MSKKYTEQTKLYSEMRDELKIKMAWTHDIDYYMSYLLMFPENKWFSTSNADKNPLCNQYNMLLKFSQIGLIESRNVPMYVNGYRKGIITYFRYRFDCKYDYNLETED